MQTHNVDTQVTREEPAFTMAQLVFGDEDITACLDVLEALADATPRTLSILGSL